MEILDVLSPMGGIHKWLSPLCCSAVLWSEMRSMTFCHLERSNRNHILKTSFWFFFNNQPTCRPTPSTGRQPRPGQRADSGAHSALRRFLGKPQRLSPLLKEQMGPGRAKPRLRQAPSPMSPGFWKAGLYPSQVGKETHDGVLFSDGGPQDQARAMPALWALRQGRETLKPRLCPRGDGAGAVGSVECLGHPRACPSRRGGQALMGRQLPRVRFPLRYLKPGSGSWRAGRGGHRLRDQDEQSRS